MGSAPHDVYMVLCYGSLSLQCRSESAAVLCCVLLPWRTDLEEETVVKSFSPPLTLMSAGLM